jgi:hypothetical protein
MSMAIFTMTSISALVMTIESVDLIPLAQILSMVFTSVYIDIEGYINVYVNSKDFIFC